LEFAPELFKGIRKRFGVTEEHLFQSFIPIHNIQAIYNFFTGSGKSSSFFFFSDNKAYVLKTLKESEKSLLLDRGILENYYEYVMNNKETLLSKYFGVYTIKVPNMQDITCFIMDNLLGADYINIERIYDLKGSTFNRKVDLSEEEI
jgi:1-phosphatidylinositol-4-phosphate 5-kinase